uniref:Secreted protein n=1 Tax=Steinernema glaseri TaxID=37863 RepID=A0A1I8AC29_9BILA
MLQSRTTVLRYLLMTRATRGHFGGASARVVEVRPPINEIDECCAWTYKTPTKTTFAVEGDANGTAETV